MLPDWAAFVLLLPVAAVLVAAAMLMVWVGSAWVQTLGAGAPVPLWTLIAVWRRGIPVHEVVTAYLVSKKAGLPVEFGRYVELRAVKRNPIRVATMLAARKLAEYPPEIDAVFNLELRGELADYFREWQRAAARGQLPPELPR
jgi:uncharacterized protein YqfA (UPF0365 family)